MEINKKTVVETINNFTDEYSFLSNEYDSPIIYEHQKFRNAESAFQCQRTNNINVKDFFSDITAFRAKILGNSLHDRGDWDDIKYAIMFNICKTKFEDSQLAQKLIDTGDAHLEYANDYDKVWGTVNGEGENLLGEILMDIRTLITSEE